MENAADGWRPAASNREENLIKSSLTRFVPFKELAWLSSSTVPLKVPPQNVQILRTIPRPLPTVNTIDTTNKTTRGLLPGTRHSTNFSSFDQHPTPQERPFKTFGELVQEFRLNSPRFVSSRLDSIDFRVARAQKRERASPIFLHATKIGGDVPRGLREMPLSALVPGLIGQSPAYLTRQKPQEPPLIWAKFDEKGALESNCAWLEASCNGIRAAIRKLGAANGEVYQATRLVGSYLGVLAKEIEVLESIDPTLEYGADAAKKAACARQARKELEAVEVADNKFLDLSKTAAMTADAVLDALIAEWRTSVGTLQMDHGAREAKGADPWKFDKTAGKLPEQKAKMSPPGVPAELPTSPKDLFKMNVDMLEGILQTLEDKREFAIDVSSALVDLKGVLEATGKEINSEIEHLTDDFKSEDDPDELPTKVVIDKVRGLEHTMINEVADAVKACDAAEAEEGPDKKTISGAISTIEDCLQTAKGLGR